jgi:hypothetical protein
VNNKERNAFDVISAEKQAYFEQRNDLLNYLLDFADELDRGGELFKEAADLIRADLNRMGFSHVRSESEDQ